MNRHPTTRSRNPRNLENARKEARGQKATEFDGDPNPKGADSDTFKPKDDTPMRLEKKEKDHH